MQRVYSFIDADNCVMCGQPAASAKVLGLRLNQSQGKWPRGKTGISVSVCRCRECGLHFPNPMPIPENLSDHYGVPPDEYWLASYFKEDPDYFSRQTKDAKRLLTFREGMTALDIGVGIGNALIKLRSGGFDVWGVEPSQPFRAKALEHTGITGERIQLAAVEDADFAPESFDLITFGAVLEHIYNPSEAIVRALRWLKPEGVIHVEVPSSDHLIAKLINAYFTLAGTNFVTNISPMHVPYHIHEFTLDSFRRNGLRSGYEVLEHHFDVASIYHLPKVMHPLLRAIMARTNTGMQLTVWLRKAR